MSRRRKPNSRRRPRRQGSALHADGSHGSTDLVSMGSGTRSNRTKLHPRSLVFVGPEEAITTFEIEHPATLGRRSGSRPPVDATIIKGCPSRYALENCDTLQMGTLPYFRKHGDSLIWDMQEGVISGDKRVEDRRDDPADLEAYEATDRESPGSHPFERALGTSTVKRLNVNETSRASLALGDNCFIWCGSLLPQSTREWSRWRDSLEDHYDHTTFLGDPRVFARVLAMVAASRRDRLYSYLDLRNPDTGHIEQCGNLTVLYGPVVYLEDPRDYILAGGDDVELIIRSIFAKTMEHRHQREYRFAILSQQDPDSDTIHLQVPLPIRRALQSSSSRGAIRPYLPEVGPPTCVPSPRLLRCFASDTAGSLADFRDGMPSTVNIRPRLHISGTRHKSSTLRTVAASTITTADYEAVEAAIRAEPRAADDARIVKLTIDGGPGTISRLYCLEGLWGRITLAAVSGEATVRFQASHPDDTTRIVGSNTEFDGQFKLSHSEQQLILTVVPMNPAASVEIAQPRRNPNLPSNHVMLSPTEDTHVTITATSEDGTSSSSLELVIESALCPPNQDKAA